MANRVLKGEPARLLKAKYLERNDHKQITKIFCKVCGAIIADSANGNRLRYRSNYAEAKIKFSDGSMHVTNVCKRCLPRLSASADLMNLVHKADIADLAEAVPELGRHADRKRPRLVATVIGTRGLP